MQQVALRTPKTKKRSHIDKRSVTTVVYHRKVCYENLEGPKISACGILVDARQTKHQCGFYISHHLVQVAKVRKNATTEHVDLNLSWGTNCVHSPVDVPETGHTAGSMGWQHCRFLPMYFGGRKMCLELDIQASITDATQHPQIKQRYQINIDPLQSEKTTPSSSVRSAFMLPLFTGISLALDI